VTLLRSRGVLAVATAALALALSACGSDGAGTSSVAPGTPAAPSSSTAEGSAAPEPASAEPFGEGCAAVAARDGSVQAATDAPVVTAAADNPELSALVEAVTAADLVDALNSAEDVTVLAPADPAFEAVPADALEALLDDNARLSAVLTYHVIDGRLPPDRLAGEHTTLNGDTVTIEGSGEAFTIGAEGTVSGRADANVTCGNLQTANAAVYVIDQVLAPPAG
jgi:uncharacterized surface protein with fasciclin (FAS1) repeats